MRWMKIKAGIKKESAAERIFWTFYSPFIKDFSECLKLRRFYFNKKSMFLKN
jgi:hypothetical protein